MRQKGMLMSCVCARSLACLASPHVRTEALASAGGCSPESKAARRSRPLTCLLYTSPSPRD
eukprot:11328225-Alexandrium_andersonii.AAC.1